MSVFVDIWASAPKCHLCAQMSMRPNVAPKCLAPKSPDTNNFDYIIIVRVIFGRVRSWSGQEKAGSGSQESEVRGQGQGSAKHWADGLSKVESPKAPACWHGNPRFAHIFNYIFA